MKDGSLASQTKYRQQQYLDGKIPGDWLDDCSGETLALLEDNIGLQPVERALIASIVLVVVAFLYRSLGA